MGQVIRKYFLSHPVQVTLSYAPFCNSNSALRVGGLFDSIVLRESFPDYTSDLDISSKLKSKYVGVWCASIWSYDEAVPV